MRILIVSTFFPPLNSIASLRPHSWAKYWSRAGHDVTVLTTAKQEDPRVALQLPPDGFRLVEVPMPSFFSKLKVVGKEPATGRQEKKGGLRVLFDYLRFKKGVFNAARMPDFTDLWAFRAMKAIKGQGSWDLVVSTAGPYSVHFVAHHLKSKRLAKHWIADYRDTWSDNYIYPGLFPFNLFEPLLERYLLKSADAVTTISEPFAEGFRKRFPFVTVETIENGFDPEDLAGIERETFFPDDGKYRIVHTGSIYLGKRDPTPLFQAIHRMADDPKKRPLLDKLEVLFVGPRQANLEFLIASHGVESWVKVVGFVCRADALRMQRDAHALLFLAWNDPSVDGVLTGKIFEYLFSKTSVVAVGAPELEASQRLILEAKAGYALGSVDAVEGYLERSLKNGGKEQLPFDEKVLERYTRKTLSERLLDVVTR